MEGKRIGDEAALEAAPERMQWRGQVGEARV